MGSLGAIFGALFDPAPGGKEVPPIVKLLKGGGVIYPSPNTLLGMELYLPISCGWAAPALVETLKAGSHTGTAFKLAPGTGILLALP